MSRLRRFAQSPEARWAARHSLLVAALGLSVLAALLPAAAQVPQLTCCPTAGGGAGGGLAGSTGSADNALLRADGTGGATVQETGILADDSNALSGWLRGRRAGAGGLTLTAADSGKTVSITSGGGADQVDLPASPSFGTFYCFAIIAADELTVQAQGAHRVYVAGTASSAGGTAKSSTVGSYLCLEYVATNMWTGPASGTWTTA